VNLVVEHIVTRAFQGAIEEERTLPLSPPKGGLKSKFVIYVNKNQFKSNKLWYKNFLCANFQQQRCSRIIPLSNGVHTLAVNVTLEPNNQPQSDTSPSTKTLSTY